MLINKEIIDFNPCYDENEKYVGTAFKEGDITSDAHEYVNYSVDVLQTIYDKDYKKIISFNSSWPEDLVLAMYEQTRFTLKECIKIVSQSCERCLNALYHQYGLEDGYPEYSKEWFETNTTCNMCKIDENSFELVRPLKLPIDDREVTTLDKDEEPKTQSPTIQADYNVIKFNGHAIKVEQISLHQYDTNESIECTVTDVIEMLKEKEKNEL
jgi:hypothetical protein